LTSTVDFIKQNMTTMPSKPPLAALAVSLLLVFAPIMVAGLTDKV
jgi:hypothetical protein